MNRLTKVIMVVFFAIGLYSLAVSVRGSDFPPIPDAQPEDGQGALLSATTDFSIISNRKQTGFYVETTTTAVNVYAGMQGPFYCPAGRALSLDNLEPFKAFFIDGTVAQDMIYELWRNN